MKKSNNFYRLEFMTSILQESYRKSMKIWLCLQNTNVRYLIVEQKVNVCCATLKFKLLVPGGQKSNGIIFILMQLLSEE